MARLPFLVSLVATAFIAVATAAVPPSDPFSDASLFPTKPAEARRSYQNLIQETSSWTDLSIFNTLVQTLNGIGALPAPPQGGTPFVVFVPTNEAFVRFLVGVSPPFEKFTDPTFILGTVGKLMAAAGNPNTPADVIKILVDVLSYHIVIGPESEFALQKAGKLKTLLNPAIDASVDASGFPKIVDAFNSTATRYARSIKLSDDGLLVAIDRVLQPFSLKPLRDILFPEAEGSASLPEGSFAPTQSIPGLPRELQAFAMPNFQLGQGPDGKLPPAPYAYPLISYAGFLLGRSDLSIFSAIVASRPELVEALLSFNRTVHPLVPTDSAFINLIAMMRVPSFDKLTADFQRDPFNPMRLQKVVQLVGRVMAILPALPSIESIIAYHVLEGPADLGARSGPQATLASDKLRIEKSDGRFFISDGDSSRPDAGVIATFPLGTGYVSVIDGLLTNFNVKATLAVLGANDVLSTDESEDSAAPSPEAGVADGPGASSVSKDEGSCFPGDARLQRADGSAVLMRDVAAGDVVRTSADGAASRVFLFSHRDAETVGEVVRLETASGHVVRATAGHYAYVNGGKLRAFGAVRVGDRVRTVEGESAVVSATRVMASGLYAPHALEADLIVDGVWVSGYSTAVRPRVAEALLAPVRWVSRRLGVMEPVGQLLYGGADRLLAFVPRGQEAY